MITFAGVHLHRPGQAEPLVSGLEFTVAPGTALVVTGPPGCGKSAVMDLAAGAVAPTGGVVTNRAPSVGWLPQRGALVSNLTLWDNTALPLRWHRGAHSAEVAATINALCEVLECDPPPRVPAATAAPEHRAVAAVARALILRPALLLADEPGEELGAAGREDLWRMLWRVQAEWGTTILAATSDPGPAAALTEARVGLPPRRTMAFRLWRG
jgi:ABC-type lipoprotein export system ATPase subunit